MSDPTIRPVTSADRDAWRRLRAALWPDGEIQHEREMEPFLARAPARWPQQAFLALVDGDVAGFVEASVRPCAEGCESREVGYVEGWYVAPAHRGSGVGRALVVAAEEWARAQGCHEMASDADPENERSRSAHLACGFEDLGLVRCFRKAL